MSVAATHGASLVPVAALVLIVAIGACDKKLPGPIPTPSSTPTLRLPTLFGQVFEVTAAGRVPAPNIDLLLTVITGNCPARICSSKVFRHNLGSGTDGRYQFRDLPPDATRAFMTGLSPGYRQTCGAAAVVNGDTQLDLEITSSSDPQPHSPVPLILTGQIYEITPAGRVGLSDAWVGLEYPFSDMPFIGVQADRGGHYVLCGVPTNQQVAVWAWADGYEDPYLWRTFTSNVTFDIELKRH